MTNSVTKKELDNALRLQTDEMVGVLQSFIQQVDTRFNSLETTVNNTDSKFDKLMNTIDGFISRLDKNETESTSRDAQFQRLVDWAKEVSIKTGIPLNNL